jgi:hypothetical protein
MSLEVTYIVKRLNANTIWRRRSEEQDQRLKNKSVVKVNKHLVGRGGAERKATKATKDNIMKR